MDQLAQNLKDERQNYYSLIGDERQPTTGGGGHAFVIQSSTRYDPNTKVNWFQELQKDVAYQTKSHHYGPLKTSEQKWRNLIDPLHKSSVNQKKAYKRNIIYTQKNLLQTDKGFSIRQPAQKLRLSNLAIKQQHSRDSEPPSLRQSSFVDIRHQSMSSDQEIGYPNQKESNFITNMRDQLTADHKSNNYFNNAATHHSSVFDQSIMSRGSPNKRQKQTESQF